jgi:hypothetical protein
VTAGTTDDLVLLHPFYSRGNIDTRPEWWSTPVLHAPRYVRTSRSTRWHRPRYGKRFSDQHPWAPGKETFTVWCGQGVGARLQQPLLWSGSVPDGEPVCGTCEGRALGAGQDPTPEGMPGLVFSGRYGLAPEWCPGGGTKLAVPHDGNRVATCRVCRRVEPMRACGGRYHADWKLAAHEATTLPDPCPEHGWYSLVPNGPADVRCACGR